MRLWHINLIEHLSNQHISGQHRECCALRGKGWGKKHSVVDYVFEYPIGKLVAYHYRIMHEAIKRGINIDKTWLDPTYRGKLLPSDPSIQLILEDYVEHDKAYLYECVDNLHSKGFKLVNM